MSIQGRNEALIACRAAVLEICTRMANGETLQADALDSVRAALESAAAEIDALREEKQAILQECMGAQKTVLAVLGYAADVEFGWSILLRRSTVARKLRDLCASTAPAPRRSRCAWFTDPDRQSSFRDPLGDLMLPSSATHRPFISGIGEAKS